MSENGVRSNARLNPPAAGRIRALDGLRGLAALWVLCHHTYLTVYPAAPAGTPGGVLAWLTDWLLYGHFAVVGFLVISGYSLAIGTVGADDRLPGGFRRFLRRRARRLLLPYWAALAVSIVLATTVVGARTGTHWDVALPVTWSAVVAHVFLLQDVVTPPAAINHAMWSIAIEWHVYLLFGLLLWFRRRIGLVAVTGVVVLLTSVGSWEWRYKGLTWQGEIGMLGCFAIGVAAREAAVRGIRLWPDSSAALRPGAIVVGRTSLVPPWGLLAAVGTLAVIAWNWVLGQGGVLAYNAAFEPAVGLITGCLLVAATTRPAGVLARVAAWRPFAAIGTFSYSLYLIHAPLVQLAWVWVAHPLGARVGQDSALGLLFPPAVVFSLAGALVFYRLVERRCLPGAGQGRRSPGTAPSPVLSAAAGSPGTCRPR